MLLKNKNEKQLKEHAWQLLRKYVKKRDYDWRGYGKCVTCSKTDESLDAGHFIHGNTKLTYLEPTNVHPQCRKCNSYLSGNLIEYTLYMQKKYGNKEVQRLRKLSKSTKTWNRKLLLKKIGELEELCRKI